MLVQCPPKGDPDRGIRPRNHLNIHLKSLLSHFIYIYIYIYIERERCICVYIYIYIHINNKNNKQRAFCPDPPLGCLTRRGLL